MAERPPRGYDRDDMPLPHTFAYKNELNCNLVTKNSTMESYIRCTRSAITPEAIEVNPKNAAFAKETGAAVAAGSQVEKMSVFTTLSLTEAAIDTDGIKALRVYYQNIHGAFPETWDAKDRITTTTIAQILEVTADDTDDDVTPTFVSDLTTEQDHPFSTVHFNEAFGDLNLNVDAKMEALVFDMDEYWDAIRFFGNGGKLKSITGPIRSVTLTRNRPTVRIFGSKFVPKNVQFGNQQTYFGRRYTCPVKTDPHQILSDAHATTNVGHVLINTIVRYNEWNKSFDQTRI